MHTNLFAKDITEFLNKIIGEITNVGIDVSSLRIDHIAYSTKTTEEYEKMLNAFIKVGNLLKEAIIGERRVAVIELYSPILYENQKIEYIELIEPKKGQVALSGWEHIEFLINSYTEIIKSYPELAWDTKHLNRDNFSRLKLTLPSGREVKFLDTPVFESICREG